MTGSPSLVLTLIAFLLLLGPLVLVHELGHYLVGRWFGVKAEAFSIGFGKELTGWTDRRGTRWKLSSLPLGGYVQFAGDMNAASMPGEVDESLTEAERAELFQSKPLWQRSLIVLAGPLTNLLFAVLIFAAFNLAYGKSVSPAEITGFSEDSAAETAGLAVADTIIAIDGDPIETYGDVYQKTVPYPGKTVNVTVDRNGKETSFPVKLKAVQESDQFENEGKIGDIGIDFIHPRVGGFPDDSAAKTAGLEEGDLITHLDGRPMNGFFDVYEYVSKRPGETVKVTVNRAGQIHRYMVLLSPVEVPGEDGKTETIGRLGIAPAGGERVPVGPVEAVSLGFNQSIGIMKMMLTGIGQIVTGDRSVKELGGPIKIAKYSGEQLSLGWSEFVSFAALISINLAFINLLPIPALDGGHLAFYAAEAVRRKPLGLRSQEWAFKTGLAFVLALMIFVTLNDLASLRIFGG